MGSVPTSSVEGGGFLEVKINCWTRNVRENCRKVPRSCQPSKVGSFIQCDI